MTDTFISTFRPPYYGHYTDAGVYVSTKKPMPWTLRQIVEYIKTDKGAAIATEQLRGITDGEITVKRKRKNPATGKFEDFEQETTVRKHFKNTHFNYATFGGVFENGHAANSLKTPSGLFVVDFDHIGNAEQVEQARQTLIADKMVQPVLLFVSPSGDGLKMVSRFTFDTDETKRRKNLQAVWRYIQETHGLQADRANTDIGRCCNLPHDPNIYFNPDAQTTLNFAEWFEPEPQRPTYDFNPVFDAMADDATRAMWYAKELQRRGSDITGTYDEWVRIGLSLANLGEAGRDIFHVVSMQNNKYNSREADQQFTHCLRGGNGSVSIATFIEKAKQAIGTTYEEEHKQIFIQQPKNNRNNMTQNHMAPQPQEQPQQEPQNNKDLTEQELQNLLFHNPTFEEIFAECGTIPPAVSTDYVFGVGDEQERLTLPRMALTVVAGQTSGGKTRFIENLALQIADINDEETNGDLLFFSLEEAKTDVLAELVNIHNNTMLNYCGTTANNLDVLKRAFRYRHAKQTATDTEQEMAALKKWADENEWLGENAKRTQVEANEAVNQILRTVEHYLMPREDMKHPLLRLYDDERFCDVELLCNAVRLYSQTSRVKAVFVDYLGMFRTTDPNEQKLPKTQQIEHILDKLEWLAKELRIPVVISAQLKRENGATPFTLRNSSVADSADIERSCNTMVVLWNSREPFNGNENENAALGNAGFVSGQGGKLFARITKRRGGVRGGAVVLNFAENTGKITMGTGVSLSRYATNIPTEATPQQPTQQNPTEELPF